ncbi:Ltp family lipoprotein [Bifidobacterium gallicum]|uniref:Prophage superinfection immunity protein n=1 Tax=Bifidobacterium gallicum DSM 20093 = LMG 11596 TaxID=561180 RepID=D1NUN9_9BIFI|nr:Ltp family lipoprotein [Bifidobacterium gallicum]EFA22540.1 hypothetical protein BIFGAL_03565 [Bifidobacterium gallicum DSM 20093 = LMG 11596]KFI59531.1 prophage superinfection immunity protein [Bifidobacterium gallicum DSM 20093 = LMG 11596]
MENNVGQSNQPQSQQPAQPAQPATQPTQPVPANTQPPVSFVDNAKPEGSGEKVYKTPWFWIIVALVCVILVLATILNVHLQERDAHDMPNADGTTQLTPQQRDDKLQERSQNTEIERERIEQFLDRQERQKDVRSQTSDKQQALEAAQLYANVLYLSQAGTYNQLVTVDHFSRADADYAMKNISVDWNKNAVRAAQSYKQWSSYTNDEIKQYLISNDLYTKSQADYAIEHVDEQPLDVIE